jgi:carbamoyltransferase
MTIQDKWIIGVNRHHNASTCLLKNGEIVFHIEEERFTKYKKDGNPYFSLRKVFEYTDKIDYLAITGFCPMPKVDYNGSDMNFINLLVLKELKKNNDNFVCIDLSYFHHQMHAANAFYASGFESSICVVVDGAGSYVNENIQEIESIYYLEYPAKATLLYKKTNENNILSNGTMFEGISRYLGFDSFDAGKTMGLSSYGKFNEKVPQKIDSSMFVNQEFNIECLNKDFQTMADLAYALQKTTQNNVLELIKKALSLKDCKNLCISGGYGLNCVANYYYLDHLPTDINIYIDPIASDAGTSIGAAKTIWHEISNDSTIRKQESIYLGPKPSYDFKLADNESIKDISYKEIIDLITNQNIVALYQGNAESGPRALGNRTLLFDPRVKNGKDIVNSIKRREEFRPFAGAILEEYAHDWFDFKGQKNSPFMMYAVNVKKEKELLIPSIIHIDGTCRIQTITQKQNIHFYNLIKEFYNITNVPILFNTSFNLAGDPLVETIEDALITLRKSNIKYLYLPELGKLILKG